MSIRNKQWCRQIIHKELSVTVNLMNCSSSLDTTIWMGASGKQQSFFKEALRLRLQNPEGKMEILYRCLLAVTTNNDIFQDQEEVSNNGIKTKGVLHRKRIKIISYSLLFVSFRFHRNLFRSSRLHLDHLDTFHIYSIRVCHWSWSYIATTKCTHAMRSCHHRGQYVFNHSATREDDVFDQNVIWTW